jgi:hypothetical protein
MLGRRLVCVVFPSVLSLVRHLYYLQIPCLNGDPATSFEVDPERLQTQEEWKQFFEKKNVGYVVRSPEYPAVIERRNQIPALLHFDQRRTAKQKCGTCKGCASIKSA